MSGSPCQSSISIRIWRLNGGAGKRARLDFAVSTQLGFLRLLTTPAVMSGAPLTMRLAWKAYDRLLTDERVFVPELDLFETALRRFSAETNSSPKLWADAYLLAFAKQLGGALVTFDRALAHRAGHGLLA